MVNDFYSLQCFSQCFGIADITNHQFDFTVEIFRSAFFRSVNLWIQNIENSNGMTDFEQSVREMGSDKSGPSCDENLLAHICSMPCGGYAKRNDSEAIRP